MVLAVIVVLIAANALYVAAEFAAVGVRQSRIQQRADRGDSLARFLMPVLRDAHALDRYIAACQIGITISSLVLGAYGQATLTPRLVPVLGDMGLDQVAAITVAATVVLVVLTVAQMILGELVPKSLALQYTTQVALWTVVPMRWSQWLMAWFIVVLNGSGTALLRALGMHDASGHRHIHAPEEIELLIAESRDGGLLEPDEHRRLSQALKLGVRTVSAIMVPRPQIQALDSDTPAEDVIRVIAVSAYTRIPVYRGDIDRIVGFVHVRDIAARALKADRSWKAADVMHEPVFIPQSLTADRVLARMRDERKQLAIVVDEFGGTAGLVTVVDILDEVLGDVTDEAQPALEPEMLPDGRVRVRGDMRLEDAARFVGFEWQGSAHTIGGLLMEQLGRVPLSGETVVVDGVEFEAERVRRHSIETVVLEPLHSVDGGEGNRPPPGSAVRPDGAAGPDVRGEV